MSIEMPSGLRWLSYLAGSSWPQGDEDKMFALADDYTAAADDLDKLLVLLHAGCDTAAANYSGVGAEQMKAQFDQFLTVDQSISKLVDALRNMGTAAHDMGAEIEHQKLQVIITLAFLAAEIAYALTTWFGAVVVPTLWVARAVQAYGHSSGEDAPGFGDLPENQRVGLREYARKFSREREWGLSGVVGGGRSDGSGSVMGDVVVDAAGVGSPGAGPGTGAGVRGLAGSPSGGSGDNSLVLAAGGDDGFVRLPGGMHGLWGQDDVPVLPVLDGSVVSAGLLGVGFEPDSLVPGYSSVGVFDNRSISVTSRDIIGL